ncbi:UNVERIFIED_CONTAM: hypothetical protein Cloal_0307 [Acetivibrio alkalicellulosi]
MSITITNIGGSMPELFISILSERRFKYEPRRY